MAQNPQGTAQVQNIIRRSQALILNVKLLGADVELAKELLANAKDALKREEFDSALQFAMQSLKEVMRLKKAHEEGKLPAKAEAPAGEAEVSTPMNIPLAKPVQGAAGQSEEEGSGSTKSGAGGDSAAGGMGQASAGGRIDSAENVIRITETSVTAPPAAAAPQQDSVSKDGVIFGHKFMNGFSYLIEEGRADKCFVIFQKLIDQAYNGLCITRTNPKLIKNHYTLEDCEMLWLTDRESTIEPTISPSLENMIYVAEEYIDANEKPLLLLDGLEYLISNNTFNSVLRFIRRLIDKISESEAILLIGVSQGAISEQELKLLEKEMTPIIM